MCFYKAGRIRYFTSLLLSVYSYLFKGWTIFSRILFGTLALLPCLVPLHSQPDLCAYKFVCMCVQAAMGGSVAWAQQYVHSIEPFLEDSSGFPKVQVGLHGDCDMMPPVLL